MASSVRRHRDKRTEQALSSSCPAQTRAEGNINKQNSNTDVAICKMATATQLRVALPDPDQAPELIGERRHLQLGTVVIVLLRSCNVGFVAADEEETAHVGVGPHGQDR